MLNTMTHATFKYKGRRVAAKRLVDVMTDKDFGWVGEFSDIHDNYTIVAKTIQQFEKKFVEFVDNRETAKKVGSINGVIGNAVPDEEW